MTRNAYILKNSIHILSQRLLNFSFCFYCKNLHANLLSKAIYPLYILEQLVKYRATSYIAKWNCNIYYPRVRKQKDARTQGHAHTHTNFATRGRGKAETQIKESVALCLNWFGLQDSSSRTI